MSEKDWVQFGDTTINYEVRRSKRRKKTVEITVDGGGVHVAAPVSTPIIQLRSIVQKRALWILKHAAESLLEVQPKRFVSGETLPYLGRNVRMIVHSEDVGSPEVRFDHWRFRITVPQCLTSDERHNETRRCIIQWYRNRATARIPQVVARWSSVLGRNEMSPVLIRDQRQRWGSCAPDGTLRFNWRAMMVKPALIEYIVVHELAHLIHRNHSADFWNLVLKVMPDAQQRRRNLRDAGKLLPL